MKKNILITGSTDGLGKIVAIQFAKYGHNVFIHGRNADKVDSLVSEIRTLSLNENIIGFVADFSDLEAVKKMAQEVIEKAPQIDILINNAGIFKSPIAKTKDGYDMRMMVNYLAPYLLTQALLPLFNIGNETRIINLSSAAQSSVSFDVMKGIEQVSENESYAQSKLALTMWSFDFAKGHKNLTIIAVNPGSLLNTKMAQEAYGQHWSTAEKGSNILYELALSEKHLGRTGTYYDNDKGDFALAHPDAYNVGLIKRLIEETNILIAS